MEETHPLLLIWVVVNYFLFAGRIVVHTHWARANRNVALTFIFIIIVFLFCGLSGYAMALPGMGMLAEYTNVTHVILGIASTALWIRTPRTIAHVIEKGE